MTPTNRLNQEIEDAERKAWDSLARYKFTMFGYWCGIWVHLNRITGSKRPNSWSNRVQLAREYVSANTSEYGHTAAPAPHPTDEPQTTTRFQPPLIPAATASGETAQ